MAQQQESTPIGEPFKDHIKSLYEKWKRENDSCSTTECKKLVQRIQYHMENSAKKGVLYSVHIPLEFDEDIRTGESAVHHLKTRLGVDCSLEFSSDEYCDPHEMVQPYVVVPSHNWTSEFPETSSVVYDTGTSSCSIC